MINKILVALDASPCASAVLSYAVELARAHNAQLTGVAVENLRDLESVGPAPIGGGHYAREMVKHRIEEAEKVIKETIENFKSVCLSSNVAFEVFWAKGDPVSIMVSHARYHDITLSGQKGLFCYGGQQGSKRLLSRLIRSGVCPLIAVPPKSVRAQKVLIVYDGSIESASAIKKFVQLQPWPDAISRILCFSGAGNSSEQLLIDSSRFCQTCGLTVETMAMRGSSKGHLLEQAMQWNADLIVMRQRAEGNWLKRIFNRSVDRLAEESPIPFLFTS